MDNILVSDPEVRKDIGVCLADFKILSEIGRGSYGVVYKVNSLINK
jgi:hypothetical protein